MAEYSITLPDGTCVEGEHHINVVHMAQILREADEDDEDSKTLQERVDEAFGSDERHWSFPLLKEGEQYFESQDGYEDPLTNSPIMFCTDVFKDRILRRTQKDLDDVQDRL